ncbi:MAG: thioesterase family protein [Actinobacteria bacterium]|nr:thioesterase family protein [Actinomycetota bacterium]
MPFEFDEATSLTALGDGRYATPIHDRWDINGNANGGYLLALVANAMRAESGRAHPVSVTMHYLSPGPAGDGVTRTSVMKSGKRFVTVAGTLAQDGRDIATAHGRPVDTLSLLLAADAFPPVMFNRFGMLGWVPTVEFTVHLRGVPAPGPIACAFSSRVIQGGMWEEDGEMWDSEGQVVALSRQLALAPKIS